MTDDEHDGEPEPGLLPGWLRLTHHESGRDIHLAERAVHGVKLERQFRQQLPSTVVLLPSGGLPVKEPISVVLTRIRAAQEADRQALRAAMMKAAPAIAETVDDHLREREDDDPRCIKCGVGSVCRRCGLCSVCSLHRRQEGEN